MVANLPGIPGGVDRALLQQLDDVDWIPPGVALLHALRLRNLRRQRGQHRFGSIPAGDVQGLQRLVDEIEYMAGVEVAVVRRRREEHVRELRRRRARTNCRDERALRALRVTHLDETTEPTSQSGSVCVR